MTDQSTVYRADSTSDLRAEVLFFFAGHSHRERVSHMLSFPGVLVDRSKGARAA
jgi:hypothetical protein